MSTTLIAVTVSLVRDGMRIERDVTHPQVQYETGDSTEFLYAATRRVLDATLDDLLEKGHIS